MARIEEILKKFEISEEERIPEIDETLRLLYGRDIKEVRLDPIWQVMMEKSERRIPSKKYQELYISLTEHKYDLI